jgi:hypothetical protein
VYGFVEELVVNDDPEYQWIDKIRTPRASNEARQLVFMKLSGKLQRQIGLKAMDLGGNTILSYQQHFDLEGESGVVVRGIGTAVTVSRVSTGGRTTSPNSGQDVAHSEFPPTHSDENMIIPQMSSSYGSEGLKYAMTTPISMPFKMVRPHSTSTDSDGQDPVHSGLKGGPSAELIVEDSLSSSEPQHSRTLQGLKTKDFPFITLKSLPSGAVAAVGGVVSARSVKLLEKFDNPEDPQTRDSWWKEVRCEVRSHMKAFNCTEVMGYSETTSICGSLCVLSACGTAVCIDWNKVAPHRVSDTQDEDQCENDSVCPLPRLPYGIPGRTVFDKNLTKCRSCMRHVVPNLLLLTTNLQSEWPIRGQGTVIQTRVCKAKKKHQGEFSAYQLNELLPQLEHKLHCRLVSELKVLGMNVIAGLSVKLSIGETVITGIAEGTAVFMEGLPPPGEFVMSQMASDVPEHDVLQLNSRQQENMKYFDLSPSTAFASQRNILSEPNSPTDGEFPDVMSISHGVPGAGSGKLLNIDEEKLRREDVTRFLSGIKVPPCFFLSTLAHVPGANGRPLSSKLYSVVRKYDIQPKQMTEHFISQECIKAVESLAFKCRHDQPCHVTNLSLSVTYPDDDEVLFMLTGLATKMATDDEEVETVFSTQLDECATKDHVTLTSCDVIECATITQHLGVINFFIIRETTNLHERGGTAGFLQMFLHESSLIVVETVKAFGGNAVVNFKLNECILMDSPNKHQGQCLLNVSGDIVMVENSSTAVSPVHHGYPSSHYVSGYPGSSRTPPLKKHTSFQETEC